MEEITFRSKWKRYKLVLEPGGKRAIPTKDGSMDVVFFPHKEIVFENYVYKTNKASELKALRENPYYGVHFWEEKPVDIEGMIRKKQDELQALLNLKRQEEEKRKVEVPCDIEGCEYVAAAANKAGALKKLQAHKVKVHGIGFYKGKEVKKENKDEK